MSYCRFSSDDFLCDAYVYEHYLGGFVIHLAATRPVYKEPLPAVVPIDKEHTTEWMVRHKKVMEMVRSAERRSIGLPHDGETFEEPTAIDCATKLTQLKDMGYNIPQLAIEALLAEASEKD